MIECVDCNFRTLYGPAIQIHLAESDHDGFVVV